MADIAPAPYQTFAGGFYSGRVESERRESADATWYQLISVDSGPVGLGATITAGQNSQALGYQIQAALTWFTTVTPAVTGNGNTPTAACVLPQTSRPYPFIGLQVVVANYGANPINCFAHPNDANNSINGLAANTAVILGPNTITPFQCITPGVWNAVDIGGGFNGSIETIVSQGNVVSGGTNSATATPITQGLVNFSSGTTGGTAGGTLPPAKAGSEISVANNAGGTISIYPAGSDTINGSASALVVSNTTVTLFFCAVNGNWLTK